VQSIASIRAVLEWYRRRLTCERFGRRFLPVPAAFAGWVVAAPGEPADVDGFRPLGAVRDLLLEAMALARLTERERVALGVRFGLVEYPAAEPVRRLADRLTMLRRRGGDGLSEHRVSQLVTSAVRSLDRIIVERGLMRPGADRVYARPVADPALAEWFRSRVPASAQPWLFERAVEEASVFAAIAGVDDEVRAVLFEIDAYHADAAEGPWPPVPRRRGRSRARALVSIALWNLVGSQAWRALPASAQTGMLRQPSTVPVGSAVGRFLAGDRGDEVVSEACAAAAAVAVRDRTAARVICDVLLGVCGRENGGRVSDDAEAQIVATAVRLRAGDDDPTAVALARNAYVARPENWWTVVALQSAVKVASAHGCYEVAEELCALADRVLAGRFSLPEGRELEAERVEFELFTHHQRSATLRRRLQDGAGLTDLERARREQLLAERACERAFELAARGVPGDATVRWLWFLTIRAGELRLIQLRRSETVSGLRLRRLDELIERARSLAAIERLGARDFVPLIKVELDAALAASEYARATELLYRLHELGWPLARTVPDILAISQPTPRRAEVPKQLRDAVDDVAAAQRDPTWGPTAADSAAGWRLARARQLAR